MGTRAHSVAMIGVIMLTTAGCNEQFFTKFHSPGEYKGKTDPLLAVAGTPEHEARLQQRFRRIQTDR